MRRVSRDGVRVCRHPPAEGKGGDGKEGSDSGARGATR